MRKLHAWWWNGLALPLTSLLASFQLLASTNIFEDRDRMLDNAMHYASVPQEEQLSRSPSLASGAKLPKEGDIARSCRSYDDELYFL